VEDYIEYSDKEQTKRDIGLCVCLMVFNATLNNISVISWGSLYAIFLIIKVQNVLQEKSDK
jgi:hypothetical protein